MATVESRTRTSIDDLVASTIVGGKVVNGRLILSTRGGAEIDAGPTSDIGTTNFRTLHAYLSKASTGPVPTLFLGSSTTQGISSSIREMCYVSILGRSMQECYPSGMANAEPNIVDLSAVIFEPNLPGIHPVNGGISSSFSNSYVTSGVLAKVAILQPRVIFHMAGANDYRTGMFTPAQMKTNILAKMADIDATLTRPAVHVICGTYAAPDTTSPAYPWSSYLQAMREVATTHPRAIFADPSPAFLAADASGPGATDPLDLIDSGLVHTTDAGHNLLATELERILEFPRVANFGSFDLYDRFRRKVLGSLETGQTWEQQSGVHVPDGTYMTVTTAGNVVVDPGFTDAEVSAIFTLSTGSVFGVIAKSTDANTRIGFYYNGPSARMEIYRGTTILGWTPGLSLTAGREYHLRLWVKGDLIRAYLDGQLVLSYTLASADAITYGGYTKHGLRFNSVTGAPKARAFGIRAL